MWKMRSVFATWKRKKEHHRVCLWEDHRNIDGQQAMSLTRTSAYSAILQCNAIQYNTLQKLSTRLMRVLSVRTVKCNTIQYSALQYNAVQKLSTRRMRVLSVRTIHTCVDRRGFLRMRVYLKNTKSDFWNTPIDIHDVVRFFYLFVPRLCTWWLFSF